MSAQRLLAIETATEICSAALYVEGEVLERHILAPQQHAALILPMAESLLADAGLDLVQLDALAFGRGPGSLPVFALQRASSRDLPSVQTCR